MNWLTSCETEDWYASRGWRRRAEVRLNAISRFRRYRTIRAARSAGVMLAPCRLSVAEVPAVPIAERWSRTTNKFSLMSMWENVHVGDVRFTRPSRGPTGSKMPPGRPVRFDRLELPWAPRRDTQPNPFAERLRVTQPQLGTDGVSDGARFARSTSGQHAGFRSCRSRWLCPRPDPLRAEASIDAYVAAVKRRVIGRMTGT